MEGYRLEVKIGKKWHMGINSYTTPEQVKLRVTELLAVGQKEKNIRVKPEISIFN